MATADGVNLIYLAVLILFVGSGLVARRQPASQLIRHALIWVVIFATGLLLFILFSR